MSSYTSGQITTNGAITSSVAKDRGTPKCGGLMVGRYLAVGNAPISLNRENHQRKVGLITIFAFPRMLHTISRKFIFILERSFKDPSISW